MPVTVLGFLSSGPHQVARMDQLGERWHLVHSPFWAHSDGIWTLTVIEDGNCDALGTILVVVAEPVVLMGPPPCWLFPALLPSEWGQVEIVVRPVEQIDSARVRRVCVKEVLALAQEDTHPTMLAVVRRGMEVVIEVAAIRGE